MRDITIAITAASYSGNKGAAAMLQSSIKQLHDVYGDRLNINLMSVYPGEDKKQLPFDFINIKVEAITKNSLAISKFNFSCSCK